MGAQGGEVSVVLEVGRQGSELGADTKVGALFPELGARGRIRAVACGQGHETEGQDDGIVELEGCALVEDQNLDQGAADALLAGLVVRAPCKQGQGVGRKGARARVHAILTHQLDTGGRRLEEVEQGVQIFGSTTKAKGQDCSFPGRGMSALKIGAGRIPKGQELAHLRVHRQAAQGQQRTADHLGLASRHERFLQQGRDLRRGTDLTRGQAAGIHARQLRAQVEEPVSVVVPPALPVRRLDLLGAGIRRARIAVDVEG